MNLNDIYLLSPEITVACLAAIIIIVDLFFKNKKIIPLITAAGIILSFLLTVHLHLNPDITANSTGFFNSFNADKFGLFFKYIILSTVLVIVLYSYDYAEKFENHQGEYYSLLLFSASGMMLLASATELITLYVALELTSLPSAALVALKRSRNAAEAGIKFLLLSAISSAILLYGMVLLYGFTGSSYLNEIATQISQSNLISNPAILLSIILITAGFGFKISAVPFQMWAPDVYEGAPTPITAFLSVASKAAGFALAIRIFYPVFSDTEISMEWGQIIAILSVLSMSLGNLIAIKQKNIKRLLAYSTIAQAGYIMVGLAAMSVPGTEYDSGPAGILFYLAGYAMTNLTAFGIIILVCSKTENYSISKFSNLLKTSPVLAVAMTLSMLSLIGIPPTVGFIGKVYLFSAAIDSGLTWLAIFGVLNSVVSAYYYLNIVKIMFMGSSEENQDNVSDSIPIKIGFITAISAAVATFIFGLYPEPIIDLANTAIQSII